MKSKSKGSTTIFDLMKADHQKVSTLLNQLSKSPQGKSNRKSKLFSKLKDEFTLHAETEEKVLYTTLETKTKTHDQALEGYEEHHLVNHLLEQLAQLSPTEEAWTAKLTVVKEMIEHHVEEEETDLFKKMKTTFTRSELEDLALRFKQTKKGRAQTQLPSSESTESEIRAS